MRPFDPAEPYTVGEWIREGVCAFFCLLVGGSIIVLVMLVLP